jgi:CheY-like chemotaxis protein
MGDPTQIHQILMNFCTNAGHAMREKGGVLEVTLEDIEVDPDFAARHADLKPRPYLNLTVSDTGHGMTPEVLKRIFDPFFTTKEKSEGTGMGLSVVHGIVNSYGGTINVYSEPGEGSSFEVFLPAIERGLEPEKRVEKPIPMGTEHILFIDDEQPMVEMGKQLLETLGYEVTARTSSIEGLELFKAQHDKFDLVITDMTMPNMTGRDLANELMSIRPHIPIILCTGFSEQIDEHKAKDMGITAFVMKPIIMREMASTIRQVLDKK